MSCLALDLSLSKTGWAIFSKGELKKFGCITPDSTNDNFQKIKNIVNAVKKIISINQIDDVVIEDLYLKIYHSNFKAWAVNFSMLMWLSRLCGAIAISLDRSPMLMTASVARKSVGIKGTAHKSEIQIWALENYLLKSKCTKYKNMLKNLIRDYKEKKLTKGQYKYRLNKLSLQIEKETGYGNDICDAIVLGKAFYNQKIKK